MSPKTPPKSSDKPLPPQTTSKPASTSVPINPKANPSTVWPNQPVGGK